MLTGPGPISTNDVTVDVQLCVCVCACVYSIYYCMCKLVSANVCMFSLINKRQKCVFPNPDL